MPNISDPNTPSGSAPKSRLRAFWDFFVLFSGISTAANLSRTQTHPVRPRGFFLFRGAGKAKANSKPGVD